MHRTFVFHGLIRNMPQIQNQSHMQSSESDIKDYLKEKKACLFRSTTQGLCKFLVISFRKNQSFLSATEKHWALTLCGAKHSASSKQSCWINQNVYFQYFKKHLNDKRRLKDKKFLQSQGLLQEGFFRASVWGFKWNALTWGTPENLCSLLLEWVIIRIRRKLLWFTLWGLFPQIYTAGPFGKGHTQFSEVY